ncbi:uncharacterized protein BYT42DRAFT_612769 [Radiomyces spectabilis]|uniref:uncharacterized protein n=1 Tax=Radiomyces spectabilis TaxID=64574 RepID=UPI00221F8AB7|nr:uncharacterized protein BYT42DRAFT_612769 [Radiomyces spectabilis]KAI8380937.1 hypothetical protein BYT42DRAFT_612769 [Radiomyces spectabilis]
MRATWIVLVNFGVLVASAPLMQSDSHTGASKAPIVPVMHLTPEQLEQFKSANTNNMEFSMAQAQTQNSPIKTDPGITFDLEDAIMVEPLDEYRERNGDDD